MAFAAVGAAALTMLGSMALKGVQMGMRMYAGRAAVEAYSIGEKELQATKEFRSDVINKAEQGYQPLSIDLEEELAFLVPGCGSSERIQMDKVLDAVGQEIPIPNRHISQFRNIRVYYSPIRGSRTNPVTNAIGKCFMIASHWSVEVDGIFYELRAHHPDRERVGLNNAKVIYTEIGQSNIRLDITSNRGPPPGADFIDIGETEMNNEQIKVIASVIFRKCYSQYDLLIDNCQLFSQLLCEILVGEEKASSVSRQMRLKSTIIFPVLATVVGAPIYWVTAELHRLLAESPLNEAMLTRAVSECLEATDRFHHHPRVYRYRQEYYALLTANDKVLRFIEKINS